MVVIVTTVKAQLSISSNDLIVSQWDDSVKDFTNGIEYTESSLFEINASETAIKHTTSTDQSIYYISSREVSKDGSIITYYLTSDVGNKYMAFLNFPKNEFRILTADHILLIYKIKAMF